MTSKYWKYSHDVDWHPVPWFCRNQFLRLAFRLLYPFLAAFLPIFPSLKWHQVYAKTQLQVMYLCLPTLCLPKTGKEPLFANFFSKKKFFGKKRLFANFFSRGNGKLLGTWNSAPSTFRDRKYFSTLFYFKSMLLFVCARWTNLDVIVNEIGLQILQKLYYQVSNFFVFF